MSTPAAASSTAGERVRQFGLALVVGGALTVSIGGQVAAVSPILGVPLAVVLALANDLATVLALVEAVSTRATNVRVWAWVVIVIAGFTAAGLNTWHTTSEPFSKLPPIWGYIVGGEPVLLAAVLSHLTALVLAERAAQRGGADLSTAPGKAMTSPVETGATAGGGDVTAGERVASPPPASPPAAVESVTPQISTRVTTPASPPVASPPAEPRPVTPEGVEEAARWGVEELASGRTAGRKKLAGQFPHLTEHYAEAASKRAKRLYDESTTTPVELVSVG